MEMKQKRGWLKVMLTTAVVLAFMAIMSVTAFAGSVANVRLVPAERAEVDLAAYVYLDVLPGDGLVDVWFHVQWDTAQMTLITTGTPNAPGGSGYLNLGYPNTWETFGAPAITGVNAGDMIVGTASTIHFEANPIGNVTESGPIALLRFRYADGVSIADIGDITLSLADAGAGRGDPATNNRIVLPTDPASVSFGAFRGIRIVWDYYSAPQASRAFIDAIIPGGAHAGWWADVVDMILAIYEYDGEIPNEARVNEVAAYWYANS